MAIVVDTLAIVRISLELVKQNIEQNKQLRDELNDYAATVETVQSAVEGIDESKASRYQLALRRVRTCLETGKEYLESIANRGKKRFAIPKKQLDHLAALRENLEALMMQLTVAFTAQTVANEDASFNALELLEHPSAKSFWARHCGKENHEVEWSRFVKAIHYELRETEGIVAMLDRPENTSLLRRSLGADDNVTVYALGDLTNEKGLLGALSFLLNDTDDEEDDLLAPEEQVSALRTEEERAEVLHRTFYIEGFVPQDYHIGPAAPLPVALSRLGTLARLCRFRSGMLVEFAAGDFPDDADLDYVGSKRINGRTLSLKREKEYTVLEARSLEQQAREVNRHSIAFSSGEENAASSEAVEELGGRTALKMLALDEAEETADEVATMKMNKMVKEQERAIARKTADGRSTEDVRREVEAKYKAKIEEYQRMHELLRERRKAERAKMQADPVVTKLVGSVPYLSSILRLFGKKANYEDEFRSRFAVDDDEEFIACASCFMFQGRQWYRRGIGGRVYLSTSHLCFYSSDAFTVVSKRIRLEDIERIQPWSILSIVGVGLSIEDRSGEELSFRGILDSDTFLKQANSAWTLARNRIRGGVLVRRGNVLVQENFALKVQKWKSRLLRLTSTFLEIFDGNDEGPETLAKSLAMEDVYFVEKMNDSSHARSNVFGVHTQGGVILFEAPSARERDEWVDAMHKVLGGSSVPALAFETFKVNVRGKVQARVLLFDFRRRILVNLNNGVERRAFSFDQISSADRADSEPRRLSVRFTFARYPYILYFSSDEDAHVAGKILNNVRDPSFRGVAFVDEPIQEGFLKMKRRGAVAFFKRFVRVGSSGRIQVFYDDANNTVFPLLCLSLTEAQVIPSKDREFKLITANRMYIFRMDGISSSVDRDKWVAAIQRSSRSRRESYRTLKLLYLSVPARREFASASDLQSDEPLRLPSTGNGNGERERAPLQANADADSHDMIPLVDKDAEFAPQHDAELESIVTSVVADDPSAAGRDGDSYGIPLPEKSSYRAAVKRGVSSLVVEEITRASLTISRESSTVRSPTTPSISDALALLASGEAFEKFIQGRKAPGRRFVWLSSAGGRGGQGGSRGSGLSTDPADVARMKLCWGGVNVAKRAAASGKCIPIGSILEVRPGKTTPTLQEPSRSMLDDRRCFSVVTKDRSLDLMHSASVAVSEWISALAVVVQHAKME